MILTPRVAFPTSSRPALRALARWACTPRVLYHALRTGMGGACSSGKGAPVRAGVCEEVAEGKTPGQVLLPLCTARWVPVCCRSLSAWS